MVRVMTHDRRGPFEEWRIVELESGRLVDSYRPDERAGFVAERHASVVDMLPIPGTQLYAACWRTSIAPDDSRAHDLGVTVLGWDGKQVAALDLPEELDVAGHPKGLWQEVWSRGTLLPVDRELGFAVWLPKSAVRVDYGMKELPGEAKWLIEELARKPYNPSDAAKAEPPSEAHEPRLLERVDFQVPPRAEPGPIRDIMAFGFASPGRLQAVRCDDGERGVFTCLLLDEQGDVLFERQLEPLDAERPRQSAWWPIGGGRWLVTRDAGQVFRSAEAMLVDAAGEVQTGLCAGFADVTAVAEGPNGGFVVLGRHYEVRSAITQGAGKAVASYDLAGSRRWLASLDGGQEEPNALDSSDDVAVTPSGVVAVVDPWEDALGLIGPDGSFLARLELAGLWDHNPSYVALIAPDGEAGFLVVEQSSSPIVRRIGLDGRIRSSVSPRYADGAKHDLLPRHLQRAPDGRLWTTDQQVLLRLEEDGVADLALGRTHAAELLDDPRSAVIDPLGRALLFDASTRAVHAFDRTGARLFVAPSLPQDFEGDYGEGDIVGSFDGRLFVKTQSFEEGWLGFDSTGKRMGPVDLGGRSELASLDSVAFTPAGSFWVHRSQDREFAFLRDEEGNELDRIERRSDRRWFERLRALAVAYSGQVAVLEDLDYSGGTAVSWFDARGRPLGQLELPATHPGDSIAYSGEWIAVHSSQAQSIWLVQTAKTRLMRMLPPDGWINAIGFSPDGRELWLVQPSERALLRYALP